MSTPKDIHVVRHGSDWAARRPNTERVSKVFDTQKVLVPFRAKLPKRPATLMRQLQIKLCRESRLIRCFTVTCWHALSHPSFGVSWYFRIDH